MFVSKNEEDKKKSNDISKISSKWGSYFNQLNTLENLNEPYLINKK